jgi:excisionase family DNA binding protein
VTAIAITPLDTHRPAPLERKSVRPAEAAALLGICRDTVYVLMRAGRLRSVKAGSARLIPIRAIDEYLANEEVSA